MALGGRTASGGGAGASQSAPTPAAQGGPPCSGLSLSAAGMGMCLPCLGGAAEDVVQTPDPDTRRRQLAEAAEKRQKENVHRGVKNPESVERKKKKQETLEKQQMNSTSAGGGGLRWQVG